MTEVTGGREPAQPEATREPAAAAAVSFQDSSSAQGTMLALQRTAGNAAVGAAIRRARAGGGGRMARGGVAPRHAPGRRELQRFLAATTPVLSRVIADDATRSTITPEAAGVMTLEELEDAINAVERELAATPIVAIEHESLDSNLAILRRARDSRAGADVASKAAWETGASVQTVGIVEPDDGVNLREGPSKDAATLRLLPFNQRLWVDRRLPGDWLRVMLEDGAYGYVAASHVNTQLPEPSARLHKIKPGESALDIVRQHYTGGAIEWGQDQRFYVNVLVLVNDEARRKGIFKPSPDAAWDDTGTKADSKIWIPSAAFAQSLKGKVSSGSLSYEVYTAIKDAAIAAGEFAVGTLAFVGGVLHGALESLWDVLVGLAHLVGMAWDILKSLIQGTLLSDARGLMESLAKLSAKDLLEAGLDWLDRKWNDPSLLSRWHFRGWIIGYAIVEIVMLIFSDGLITALKWAGKAGKFAKVLSKLPVIAKLSDAAKAAKIAKGAKVEKLVEGLKAGKAAEAGEAAKAAKAAEAAEAAKVAKAGEALETGADASKMTGHTGELASVFRRGGKIRKLRSVSLKQLRQVLGKAGVSPSGYKLQKASAADLAALAAAGDDPANIYGWVSRTGAGLVRDAKGRPIINFTPKGLSSLKEAVTTFGHEAKHIKDFAAGMSVSSEALAELAGEKLWLFVSKTL